MTDPSDTTTDMNFDRFERILNDEQRLVHTSLTGGILELHPGANGMVFATENISFSILCALIKIKTERNPVIMQSYTIAGKAFHICSVDREFRELMENVMLHFYFCRRDEFEKFLKIDSSLSRMTLQLIPNVGHEWICRDGVTPVDSCGVLLRELVHFAVHSPGESKAKILWRYLTMCWPKNLAARFESMDRCDERH